MVERGIVLRDGDEVCAPDAEHESAAAYWERQYRLVNGDYLALRRVLRDLRQENERLSRRQTIVYDGVVYGVDYASSSTASW